MSRRSRRGSGLAALGVPRRGGAIYELALTHRSYAFEQPTPLPHNERLEFLGDAVLGLVVTDLIYHRHPDLSEGDLARLRASLVNTAALAQAARMVDLGPHLRLGKGEEASGGRDKDSLLADTFEAVIGAVYEDRGLRAVRKALIPLFERLMAEDAASSFDPKTALQELSVRVRGARPSYRVAASGPDHDKRFNAHVYIADQLCGVGSGRSKKEAEQGAAREALASLAQEGGPDARAS